HRRGDRDPPQPATERHAFRLRLVVVFGVGGRVGRRLLLRRRLIAGGRLHRLGRRRGNIARRRRERGRRGRLVGRHGRRFVGRVRACPVPDHLLFRHAIFERVQLGGGRATAPALEQRLLWQARGLLDRLFQRGSHVPRRGVAILGALGERLAD